MSVVLNVPPARQYDLITDFLDTDMLKFYSDILRIEKMCIQKGMTTKFRYFPMMSVSTLGTLNTESFSDRVLSCVKLVVADLHVRLKPSECKVMEDPL